MHAVALAAPTEGEWIGKAGYGDGNSGNFCTGEAKVKSARVSGNLLELNINTDGNDNPATLDIRSDGSVKTYAAFSAFGTAPKGQGLQGGDFLFVGQFKGDTFEGSVSRGIGGHDLYLCMVEFKLARKGAVEARAMFTNENPEVLRLERQVAETRRQGLIHTVAEVQGPADPFRPFDGAWTGVIRSDDPARCKIQSKVKEVSVKGSAVTITTTSGSDSADLEGGGRLIKWLSVSVRNIQTGDTESLHAKLDGAFRENEFSGGVSGSIGDGGTCSATVKLGRKGSVHAEALIKGVDPKLLRLQRQLAAVTPNSAVSQAETERLAQERAEQEKQLAELRAEQEKLEAQRKAEQERIARLRAEASQLKSKQPKGIPSDLKLGNYHALVIGANNYANLPKLKTAVADANAVAKILSEEYGFKVRKL